MRPTEEKSEEKSAEKDKKKSRSNVHWTDDVVDNEHMNKKKSKICCIFHPQREFGESSDEAGSSESSDSSDSSGDEKKPAEDGHEGHEHSHACRKHRRGKKTQKALTPNAYERQPRYVNHSEVPTNAI